jgi:hypothetical protein
MQDFSRLRIVEIGDKPFIKQAFPDQVAYFSTWPEDDARTLSTDGSCIVSLATLGNLWRVLREPETSLVVCHPTFFSPWHWRWMTRALFDRRILRRSVPFLQAMGPQVLRWRVTAPIAILDHEDLPIINRNNFFLLDRCRIYFKRELPPDRWRLFLKTGHANLPTPRFREAARHRARIDKLRPISLGLPLSAPTPFPVESTEKSADIFFAGRMEGSSFIRQRGFSELLALRERGLVIDIPERPLLQLEFYRRCAQARLTWSPEGLGWDCFRHYEAAMCGSVPLINQPTIERHRPLLQGTHAVYYDIEEGGLTHAVVAALADNPGLEAMGRAARTHVLAHHTPAALARHIVRTSLEPIVHR